MIMQADGRPELHRVEWTRCGPVLRVAFGESRLFGQNPYLDNTAANNCALAGEKSRIVGSAHAYSREAGLYRVPGAMFGMTG
jgi:hypothetical protein